MPSTLENKILLENRSKTKNKNSRSNSDQQRIKLIRPTGKKLDQHESEQKTWKLKKGGQPLSASLIWQQSSSSSYDADPEKDEKAVFYIVADKSSVE